MASTTTQPSWEDMMRQMLAQQQGSTVNVPFTNAPGAVADAPSTSTPNPRRGKPNMQWRDVEEGDLLEDTDTGLRYIARKAKGSLTVEPEEKGMERKIYGAGGSGEYYADSHIESNDWKFIGKFKAKAKIGWDSVILPEDKKQAIMDAIKQVDNHDLIFEEWGFGEVFEKGTAISVLLYGPPGTGKTLCAQAVAEQLGYKLQIIGTAEIESSEPGGAERAIKAFFKEANDHGKTVLLFDECDSLIADRRAIGMILGAQVNTLLTELERYTGVVFFTTNRLEKLDEAFDRRLSLKMELPMPDVKLREQIWKRMFPKKAPLAKDINWSALATVEIAGGHIKNIVLRSARAAANSKKKKITMDVIVEALEQEVMAMQQFQKAVKSSTIPRLAGGGVGMGISRGVTATKVGPDGTK